MWRVTLISALLCVHGCASEESDLLALESSESSSSPLAQLLATAAGAREPILPLAPQHFRPKRKPQRFRLNGGERPRFKPRREQVTESEEVAATEAPKRSKFSGFSRRGSRPNLSRFQPAAAVQETTTEAVTLETELPTEAPQFQAQDFFVTTQRTEVDAIEQEGFAAPIVAVSNSVVEDRSILEEVRARTIAITGAQPVGVTKDFSHRSKGARQFQTSRDDTPRDNNYRDDFSRVESLQGESSPRVESPRRDSPRLRGGRRPSRPQKERPVVPAADREYEDESNSLVPAPRRRGNRRKSAEHNVGTVERYRYENEDGSITWGYENDDGGYKEEIIGVDCVTKGKYGYIDPTGEVREYSYTGGVRCDPLTKKLSSADESQVTGANGHGFYDYAQNKFVMPDGRRVRVVVNQSNKARGRRY